MRLTLTAAILYLFLAPNLAIANVDSLKNIIHGTSFSSEEKIVALRELVGWFSQHQLDSALHYANVHLQWTETTGDTVRIVDALHVLGSINELRVNPVEAARFVERASHLIEQTGNQTSKFHNLNLRAAIAGDLLDPAKELYHHQQALTVAMELSDSGLITISLNNLANMYRIVGNLEKASDSYSKALEICEASGNFLGANTVMLNQAQLANDRNQFTRAIENLSPVIEYFTKHGHKKYLAFAYSTLGFSYFGLQDYQLVLTYTERCKKLLQETRSNYGLAEAHMLTGNTYAALNRNDSALHFLNLAMKLVEETQSSEELISCTKALYHFHKQHGDPTQALNYHERYIGLRDSLKGITARYTIQKTQMSFQLKKAHYHDSLLFEQVRQTEQMELQLAHSKRNTYFALALLAVILTSITVLIYLRFKNFKAKLEKQTLLNQLDKLKSAVVKDLVLADDPQITPSPAIHRPQIEQNISSKLNDTDWAILLALYQTPMLTNKALAQKVNKSFEGVRSSLKKMYRLFDLNDINGSRKAALIIKAIEFSGAETQPQTL